jgi:hypothetical protein
MKEHMDRAFSGLLTFEILSSTPAIAATVAPLHWLFAV